MLRPRIFIFALLAALFGPHETHAVTYTWNGPASPCGSTLQNCINFASAGDVVQVATNVSINEDLTIDKSLTLRAAPGFSPALSPLRIVLLTNPNPRSNSIRFENFTLSRGFVNAVQISSGTFDVGIQFLTILNTFNSRPEIEVRTGSSGSFGPMQVGIVGNRLTIPAASQSTGTGAISLQGGGASSLTGLIQRNRVDVFQGGQEPAIGVFNVGATTDVTVVANEVRGADYNDGVMFFQFGPGSSHFRFLDNLVVGQTTDSGVPAAYAALIDDGSATFEIVNNTAADSDNGIFVLGRDDLGASWSGVVANNVVAGMSGSGIVIGQPLQSSGVVDNDHNLVFNVASNLFTPGPGTLFSDPLFVGGGNYRLTDPSPARNSGSNARVPPDLTTDLDGGARLVATVDMGAYESTSLVDAGSPSVASLRLEANAPNPFIESTVIRYELPRAERVWLGIYDVRGRLVRGLVSDALQGAGPHTSQWDGKDADGRAMSAGVYFCRLKAGEHALARAIVLAD
jgi:hypothetical protein